MAKLTAALNVVHDAAKYTALKRHHDTYKDILDTCDRTIKQHNRTVQETTHQLESLKLAYNSGLSQLHAVDPEASRAFAARVPAPRADPGYAPNIYNTALTDEDQNLEELINNMRPDEEIDAESVATPAALTISLLPHQRKGLAWLQQMEAKPSNKGGILADDMGLGKTVQALALILSRALEDRKRKTTLVVAPVALLKQWEAEIGSKVKPEHRLSVAIYQAGKKLKSFGHLARHDVVLVSYGTLSSEMKKHYKRVLAELDKERGSDLPGDDEGGDEGYVSPFFARNAVFHRVILDEAQWIKNKKTLASRSCAMVKASFRWCLSGTPMQNGVIELYPLIRFLKIRPYCVETRFRADIAVPIKNQSGNYGRDDTDQAMNRLRALLAALLLRRTKTSKIDGKPILSLPEKHVAMDKVVMVAEEDAFYKALEDQTAKKAQQLLQQKGVGTFLSIFTLLLRLRQACCHSYLVELGIRNAKEQAGETAWKGQYEDVIKLDGQVQRRVREEVEREETYSCAICYEPPESMEEVVLLSPCGHLLCRECVPSFFDRFAENEAPEGKRVAKCYACQRNAMEAHCIGYGMFEKVWVLGWARDRVVAHYTAASPRPKSRDQQVLELIRESGGEFTPLAKMDQAVTLVEEILAKDPLEKIIIFSQFTLLFNLLKLVLDAKGIQFLRYDGSMSGDERNNTIGRFYNEPERSVLLLSLKAGNVGLTLTCANHVIIMDPFWNPFVEEQAMDRAHRIGQHKEVFVHRLLISDTVEDRIMKLQETKKELVESALDEKGMKVAGSLGRQELGFLFGLNKLR
ncbi:hypothetical protein BABINDRAFT_37281 [Babjeviella inositovora NRRL Y-12698]|uniref:RING-type domain-containing protein n=1 Tax=Babjeviella inositovora NRRL Y-12698 TaxID=984486 RepID=A0A1E3QNZ0_9ASCO|nr:uncharacterized protein BABINDRAFT_37281 [Babjeviella inositovora NRRL Y-12698]ODQ79391.1 hypothetical protein BABINDRAFT_37281 [Babjeviella inositovora NRRL Y-12698]